MKKLLFLIICLFYSIQAICQQPSGPNEVVQLTLPKGTAKLDEKQLHILSHRKFDDKTAMIFHDHVYKKNGLLIYYINITTAQILKKSLENQQKLMVSLIGQITDNVVDDSKIVTINNIRFFIIDYHEHDNKYIKFTSDFDKHNRQINGFIEYKSPDDTEAKQYLQELLGSMHFKNQ